MLELSKEEFARYDRHIILPEVGIEGQKKLKAGKVLVVGAGGLGSPVLLYLAAAGIGNIGIVDFDEVDDSNLQRQVLYGQADVGESKAKQAKKRILDLNPHINVTVYTERLTRENVSRIFEPYDVIADGTDNFATRYLVNDACVLLGKINVYASIFRFDGQVSVFNYPHKDGTIGPNYRDLFPEPPAPDSIPSCAEGGVLGVLPGIIGAMQANEVIKVIGGIGKPLIGRLFLFNALNFQSQTMEIGQVSNVQITELEDYEVSCGLKKTTSMKELNVTELKDWMDSKKAFQLIDVREQDEYASSNIGGELMPLSELQNHFDKVKVDQTVVVHCKAGGRSRKAIEVLQQKFPNTEFYNLEGGILEWVKMVTKV